MKTILNLILISIGLATLSGCDNLSYKKLKTGVIYKIYPGDSKDSLPVTNNVIKFNIVRKFNDSVIYDSHDKMPVFIQLNNPPETDYNPFDVLYYLKKGDSAMIIEMYDTLLKKGLAQQLPIKGKKGDRLVNYVHILEVYRADSIARKDYEAEMAKDKPRQEKEMAEMKAKAEKEKKEQFEKDMATWKKSGEIDKEVKEIETYLATKKITTQKTEQGTYVLISEKGNGSTVTDGKYVAIKYKGKLLLTDSIFESNTLTFQIGRGEMIRGWEDGLKLFNEGGIGTLYIPAFMGWGGGPGPGGKPFESTIFDVEVIKVSDSQEIVNAAKQKTDSLEAAKKTPPAKK